MRNVPGAPRDSLFGPVVFGKGGGAPSPPDPAETARAQAQANREAIRESAKVNQIAINSPYGRQFYTGSIGEPDRALNIELTPGGEEARLAQEQLATLIAGAGAETLGPRALERLAAPDSTAVEQAIFERGMSRLGPRYEERGEQLRSRLMGQGIAEGSRAWNQATGEFERGRSEAEENLALSSTIAGAEENRAQRAAAINELSAILRGAPAVGQPMTQMPAQYQVAPPDIAGLTMGNYLGQLNAYNTQASNLGGLYGLAGQLGAAAIGSYPWGGGGGATSLGFNPQSLAGWSDRRLKRNIEPAGTWLGLRWYTYRLAWEAKRRLGVMAQEVMGRHPEAVQRIGPWLAVDYGRLIGLAELAVSRRAGLRVGSSGSTSTSLSHSVGMMKLKNAVAHALGPIGEAEIPAGLEVGAGALLRAGAAGQNEGSDEKGDLVHRSLRVAHA